MVSVGQWLLVYIRFLVSRLMWIMTTSRGNQAIGNTVYTLGIGRTKPQDLMDTFRSLGIYHLVDVRDSSRQRKPSGWVPSKLASLCSQVGVGYHDESSILGFRPDYRLFALSDDFTKALVSLTQLVSEGNVLLLCSEVDYRKCHRKLIGSYLSRRGVLVRHIGMGLLPNFQSTLEASLAERPLSRRMFTIGFTRKSMREFIELLRAAKVKRLVDIRLRPVSQYSGFARKDDLEFLLEAFDIEYIHAPELAPTGDLLDGYRTDGDWRRYEREFRLLLSKRKPDELLARLLAPGMNVAFLCTEDEPERCHRRLVAEYARALYPDLRL